MADVDAGPKPDTQDVTEVRLLNHTHCWTIKGYSNCDKYLETLITIKDDHGGGGGPAADARACKQATFKARMHPKGDKDGNLEYVFFQVLTDDKALKDKFKAKFTLYNARDEEARTIVFDGDREGLVGHFEYLRKDTLVEFISPEVSEDLESFLQTGKFTDFKIEYANGGEIECHKAMLAARSPVFLAMLEAEDSEESKTGRVAIKDVDYEVIRNLLLFIYSGTAPNLEKHALDLLAVADRFQVQGLKDAAQLCLCSSLTVDTAASYLMYADKHNAAQLRKSAMSFASRNLNNIRTTAGWAELVKQRGPLLVNEILSSVCDEQQEPSVYWSACEQNEEDGDYLPLDVT